MYLCSIMQYVHRTALGRSHGGLLSQSFMERSVLSVNQGAPSHVEGPLSRGSFLHGTPGLYNSRFLIVIFTNKSFQGITFLLLQGLMKWHNQNRKCDVLQEVTSALRPANQNNLAEELASLLLVRK